MRFEGDIRYIIAAVNASPSADNLITFAQNLPNVIELHSQLSIVQSVVLDGSGSGITIWPAQGVNCRLFNIAANGINVTITGLSLSSGKTGSFGGAIFSVGNLTLTDDSLINNQASFRGGAVYSSSGDLTVTNCSIVYNVAGTDGGGIGYDGEGSLQISSTEIRNNSAQATDPNQPWNGASGKGGGVYIGEYAVATVDAQSVITGNYAGYGAGLYNSRILNVSASTIQGNGWQANGVRGAGIYNAGTLGIDGQTEISGNGAGTGVFGAPGGAIYQAGTFTLTQVYNSVLSGNYANQGGAVYVAGGRMELTTVTMSGNTANEGAALYASGASIVTLVACRGNGNRTIVVNGGIIRSGGGATVRQFQGTNISQNDPDDPTTAAFLAQGDGDTVQDSSIQSNTGVGLKVDGVTAGLLQNSTITGNGDADHPDILIVGGDIAAEGTNLSNTFSQTGGELKGDGELDIDTSTKWTGGKMSGNGTTYVTAGTLTITGGVTLDSRTLNNGGTATWDGAISGDGLGTFKNTGTLTVTAATLTDTLENDGDLSLGDSITASSLDVTGMYTENGTLHFKLGDSGGNSDSLSASNVNLSGTLNLIATSSTLADSYTIVSNTGSSPVNGCFSGLAEGATISLNGKSFKITYEGGDGNDVVLRFAPDPMTITMAWSPSGDPNATILTLA